MRHSDPRAPVPKVRRLRVGFAHVVVGAEKNRPRRRRERRVILSGVRRFLLFRRDSCDGRRAKSENLSSI
jgi:hypothetical protein